MQVAAVHHRIAIDLDRDCQQSLLRRRRKRPQLASSRSVRVDDDWSKPHHPTASKCDNNFVSTKNRNRLRMAFPNASWQEEVFLTWARAYIHFTNGGAHRFAFLKPDEPSEWLHSDESTKGKSSRIRCLLCSKHGDRLRATTTFFLQRVTVRKLHWKKTLLWRSARLICTRGRFSWTTADENCQRKILRSMKLWRVTRSASSEDWGSCVSRLLDLDLDMMGRCLTTSLQSSSSWRGGMVSALVKRTTTRTNVEISRT